MNLPCDSFKELCQADSLYIEHEKAVVSLIERYLKHREGLPLLDEENPMKDWTHLTEEEKKKRQEEDTKKGEEAKKAKDEEEKKETDKFNALDELGKIQYKWTKKVSEVHAKALERLAVKRLTKVQKIELLKAIRYGFLHHEELLSMASNPLFELAKNFIVEGLSAKLESYDNLKSKGLQINIEPRVYYDVDCEKPNKEKDDDKKDKKDKADKKDKKEDPSDKGVGGLLKMFKETEA